MGTNKVSGKNIPEPGKTTRLFRLARFLIALP